MCQYEIWLGIGQFLPIFPAPQNSGCQYVPLTSFRQSTERALSAIPSPSFPENTVGDGSTSITWLQDVFFLKLQVRDARSAVQSFSTYPPGLIPREDRDPAPLRIVGNSSPIDTAQCRRRLESSYFFCDFAFCWSRLYLRICGCYHRLEFICGFFNEIFKTYVVC